MGAYKSVIERLRAKVDTSGGPDACHPWVGYRGPKGYGQIGRERPCRGTTATHRLAWELANGRPPKPGAVIMHSCDNPPCCNPAHLSEGKPADNSTDMAAKGRSTRGERNPRAKLSARQVLDIRRRLELKTCSQHTLATEYGVDASVISDINTRKSWNHI